MPDRINAMTDAEIKNTLLTIMDEVHAYCTRNSLKYSLAYGTLLGAVRHGGFIPWDDDIDIIMPRPDYEAFIAHFTSPTLKVVSLADTGYYFPYAKVYDTRTCLREYAHYAYPDMGVYIDIFPLDTLEKNRFLRALKYRLVNALRKTSIVKQIKSSPDRDRLKNFTLAVLQAAAGPVPMGPLIKTIDLLGKTCLAAASDECSVCLDRFKLIPLQQSWFDALTTVPFEGREYLAIPAIERYLTDIYGDYLTPPPAARRVTHHAYDAAWKNTNATA